MSEIEKMYENAGIVKLLYCDICKAQEHALGLCAETKCEPFYPPFTAEKQIELIKLLGSIRDYTVEIDKFKGVYYVGCRLAGVINKLWADMSEEEKQQVKGILE